MSEKPRMTQEEMVLNYLRQQPDHSTTSIDIAFTLYIVDGRKVISSLRRKGHRIIGRPVTKKNRFGQPVTFNIYTLEEN